ncbi:MAG: ABC transporter permease [Gaiellales bacterium]
MTARATVATAARVIGQLRRDPRTVALLLLVPVALLVLLDELFTGQRQVFQRVGVPMLGLFPLISMFLVTSITMLRERTSGTLERLLTLPLSKLDILAGYGLAFGTVALVQGVVVSIVGFGLLDLEVVNPRAVVVGLAVANALLGMALGLFVSAFARTEFQAVQFMPALIFPQVMLCGLFVARENMAGWLHAISGVLPMTYAYDALRRAATQPALGSEFVRDVTITAAATLLALALGAATLRRRTD